jgi:hypothetical protein
VTRSTAAAALGLALFLMLTPTAAASTPTISYSIDGIPGTNGWYRGSSHGDNVLVHWSVSADATSSNCLTVVAVPGPTAGTTQTCWAQNDAGTATAVTELIKIDATPPTGVTARLARKPDFKGWYNHPVRIRWTGSDSTSGIAHCTSAKYRGPDSGAATVNGGCVDQAGNTAYGPVELAYDATPPVLRQVKEDSTHAGDALSWSSSSTSDRIVVRRRVRGRKVATTIFDGSATKLNDEKTRPGVEYLYSLQSFDQAGNPSKVVSVDGPPKLLILEEKTRYAPHAAPNPILRWHRVRGAAYYNVQLFRGSKRIFAAWPRMRQVGLPTTWKWSGHRVQLSPGRYRWYVWAGYGPRKLAQYRSVGSAKFVVPRS